MYQSTEDYSYLLPTVEQTRLCEQHTMSSEPITSLDLMERAGTCCARHLTEFIQQNRFKQIFIFCGTGNNGGDGLVIARKLRQTAPTDNIPVTVILCQKPEAKYSPEMSTNLSRWNDIADKSTQAETIIFNPEEFPAIPDSSLIIDAIFGIGLSRPAIGVHAEAIRAINASDAFTIAIDTPSGLFCDRHTPHENDIVMANATLSIQFQKLAFLTAEAFPFYGTVHVVEIQMTPPQTLACARELITTQMVANMLKERNPYANKGNFGHGLLIAGCDNMPGAAVLASKAALRGGIGKLTVHTAGTATLVLPTVLPEAILHKDPDSLVVSDLDWSTLQSNINAIAIGPGLGTHRKTFTLIKDILDTVNAPVILDADALNMLAENKTWMAYLPQNSILTPHLKEFDRLAGPSANDFERIEKAREFAKRYNIILVLKGHHTVITMPDENQFFNTTGNAGMATAGSGDVLTGILLALMAQGYNPAESAIIGVFVHGLSGDLYCQDKSSVSLIASDLTDNIGKAFHQLEQFTAQS